MCNDNFFLKHALRLTSGLYPLIAREQQHVSAKLSWLERANEGDILEKISTP